MQGLHAVVGFGGTQHAEHQFGLREHLPGIVIGKDRVSNVASSLFEVMASISASCNDMPRSKAGMKCSGRILSNGGTPCGVSHSVKTGFPRPFPGIA